MFNAGPETRSQLSLPHRKRNSSRNIVHFEAPDFMRNVYCTHDEKAV